jgi:hypothetical protein
MALKERRKSEEKLYSFRSKMAINFRIERPSVGEEKVCCASLFVLFHYLSIA